MAKNKQYKIPVLDGLSWLCEEYRESAAKIMRKLESDGIITAAELKSIVDENHIDNARVPQLCVFISCISDFVGIDRELVIRVSVDIEHSCYKHIFSRFEKDTNTIDRSWGSPEFISAYSDVCGDICMTITGRCRIQEDYSQDYQKFIAMIKEIAEDNDFDVDSFVRNGIESYFPDSIKEELKDIEEKKNIKIEQKISTLYVCPRCKGNKCSWKGVQTRGLDEEITIMASCMNPVCRHKFIAS